MAVYAQKAVFAGRYELDQLIGEGGFSEVWKANDLMADDAVVALKIYAPEKGLDASGVRQFRKEFSITHKLSHPYLMKVYHFDIADGSPYLIMPYCQRGSLARALAETGPLSELQLARLMMQIGDALQELHDQEPPILHQDIKPDNILILSEQRYLLTDFGISTQTRHTLHKSTSSARSLTVAYAPPERFDSSPVSNEASDIFSLGVSLYEMCTGHIPWDGYGGQSLLKGARIPDLPSIYPQELNRMLRTCMALEPSERPTAAQVKAWGQHYLEQQYWHIPAEKKESSATYTRYLVPFLVLAVIVGIGLFFGFRANTQNGLTAQDQPFAKEQVSNTAIGESAYNDNDKREESSIVEVEAKPTGKKVSNNSHSLEALLHELSNPAISREKRKEIRQQLLARFSSGNATVFGETGGLVSKYTADGFLDLMLNVPHKIVIGSVQNDNNKKIRELHLRMDPDFGNQ